MMRKIADVARKPGLAYLFSASLLGCDDFKAQSAEPPVRVEPPAANSPWLDEVLNLEWGEPYNAIFWGIPHGTAPVYDTLTVGMVPDPNVYDVRSVRAEFCSEGNEDIDGLLDNHSKEGKQVGLKGVVRQHPIGETRKMQLREVYVASGDGTVTAYPVMPCP